MGSAARLGSLICFHLHRRREVVEKTFIDVTAAFRAPMLAIPTRAATMLAGENDRDVIQQQLDDLVRDALYELSTVEIQAVDENGAHDRGAYGHTGAA